MNNLGLRLKRSTNAPSPEETFEAAVFPIIIANPVNSSLYVVFHETPLIGHDQANTYFLQSTNAGVSWGAPIQVNVETNTVPTDQWQPVMTVKPDGSQLFIAWYDRKNDPGSNSLIQTYGVFAK